MIPLFFMGEPWGSRDPFLFFKDSRRPLDAQVREGRRREFAHFAAFSDEARRASIPDPNARSTFEASVADMAHAGSGEGAEWTDWFTALLGVRREHIQPHVDTAGALGGHVLGEGAVSATGLSATAPGGWR